MSTGPLRQGVTTGTCATAAAVAATHWLFHREVLQQVCVDLPPYEPALNRSAAQRLIAIDRVIADGESSARADVIKDAGDDPDVTHGARVFSRVQLRADAGIEFRADEGVGVVTLPGLPLQVGEPAINPVPRRMMTHHLQAYSRQCRYNGGFVVSVGIENGRRLAEKTMNARLGIVGGLSILGTSGIVKPFSCSAYIAAIRQGIDVAMSNQARRLFVCTGSTSELFLQNRFDHEPDFAFIETGDFVDALINYLKKRAAGVPVVFAAGFAKACKLADGHTRLHRKDSQLDFSALARVAASAGAGGDLIDRIVHANTAAQVLQWCMQAGVPLAEQVAHLARQQLQAAIEGLQSFYCVDRQGQCLAQA